MSKTTFEKILMNRSFLCILIWLTLLKCLPYTACTKLDTLTRNDKNETIIAYCDYDIDKFDCLNIKCNANKRLNRIPSSLHRLINVSLTSNQLLCSIDFRDSGIDRITKNTVENINLIYNDLMLSNPNYRFNRLKLMFSNLKFFEPFDLNNLNIALYIHNSDFTHVATKSLQLASSRMELNIIGSILSETQWLHLLDSANLRLFSLRNIPNLETVFDTTVQVKTPGTKLSRIQPANRHQVPIASIRDLKIYNSPLPQLINAQFFLFKILAYIEQLELIGCSISVLQPNLFVEFHMALRSLRILNLGNNLITRIENNTFKGLNNLILLDLDENPIELIESNALAYLTKLKTLSLNGNIKIVQLMQNPIWFQSYLFNSTLNREINLYEISMISPQWSGNFCLVEAFSKLNLRSQSDFYINQNKTRNLILFEPNKNIDSKSLSDTSYCNYKFVCHNRIYFSKTIWNLDLAPLCSLVNSVNRVCSFYKLSQQCAHEVRGEMRQFEMLTDELNYEDYNSTLTDCKDTSHRAVFRNLRFIVIVVVGMALGIISLTLGFFYYSYSKNKEIFSIEKKIYDEQGSNVDQKLMLANALSDTDTGKTKSLFGNDYYVFLLSSKHVRNC